MGCIHLYFIVYDLVVILHPTLVNWAAHGGCPIHCQVHITTRTLQPAKDASGAYGFSIFQIHVISARRSGL